MADVDATSPQAPRAPRNLAGLIPLALCWAAALLPFVLYLVHRSDAEQAVVLANFVKRWTLRVLITVPLAALVAAIVYPPFPAWLRLFADRTSTAWTVDRAPLQRALSELQHLETAQRHFEVAKLAWLRADLPLATTHAERAAALDDGMPQVQYLLGQVLFRAKQWRRAHDAFAAAERLEPGHAFGNALLHQARCAHLLGDRERARGLFEQHEREHGGGHRSNYWFGETLAALGVRDEAARKFAVAAKAPPQRLTAEENMFRALARVRARRVRAGGST